MPQIEVLYTPPADSTTGVLDTFRAVVGAELAEGWRVIGSTPMPGFDHVSLVKLEHDTSASSIPVRELLATAAHPHIQLLLKTDPNLPGSAQPVASKPAEPEPLSLPLPLEVPRVLATSEPDGNKRAALQGILAGLAISLVLGRLTPPASVVRRMFDPATPTGAVPIGILCLFFWGITYGVNRWRRLLAIESLNRDDLLPAVIAALHTHGVRRLEEALRGRSDEYRVVQHSPLLRRVWMTLEQWMIRPNLQNAHLVIEQQVVSDREATQRSYNLLRIFVWATPVLGLIGTVVGISIAVGGFASFLSTNVDDVSKIKAGLVGVTGGLSFAFLITLEGLLSSLILMLFTSNVQTREERLYAEVERNIAERFLPELQRLAPELDSAGIPEGTDEWTDALADVARRVIRAIEIAGKKMLTHWDETHAAHVSDLSEVRETVERTALSYAKAIEHTGTTVNGLAAVTKDVLEAQAALQLAVKQLHETTTATRRTSRSPVK